MGKGRYERKHQRRHRLFPLVILSLAVVPLCTFLLFGRKTPVQTPNGVAPDQIDSGEPMPNSIAIPGYEGIHLDANTTAQNIGFPNPASNTCYFQITLFLEDGTQLWQSSLVKPGEISSPISLNKPLPKGTYSNALLRFDCFSMDNNHSALNGAETKLTLWVG